MPTDQLETFQIVNPIYQNLGTCNQSFHVVFSTPLSQKRQSSKQISRSLGRSIAIHFDCIGIPVDLLYIAQQIGIFASIPNQIQIIAHSLPDLRTFSLYMLREEHEN